VLPTYNRHRFLREAVESVQAQTLRDWELIVVDDGSADDTRAYLEAIDDPRVQCVPLAHSGNKSLVRNAGIARARAEWIAFLDSDDLWRPEKLAQQLERVEASRDSRWSCTAVSFIDAAGAPIARRAGPSTPLSGWILKALLTFETEATMPTLMVHRSMLAEVGGFDENVGMREDYDLELRLAERSAIVALQEPLTSVRHHEGRSSGSKRSADLHAGTARVLRRLAAASASDEVKAICRAQAARQMAFRARALSRAGDHADALAAVGEGFRDTLWQRELWRAGIGCALRAVGVKR
jgi:glycosyltransferase involved in cell wall biosynthesis